MQAVGFGWELAVRCGRGIGGGEMTEPHMPTNCASCCWLSWGYTKRRARSQNDLLLSLILGQCRQKRMQCTAGLPCDIEFDVVNKRASSRRDARSRRQAPSSGMFSEQAWAEIARSLELSPRELQILRGIFDNRIELAIAGDLGISPHTVHSHIERLHHKLGVADRLELILRITNEFLVLTAAPESILPSICANRTAGRCPLRS